TNGEPVADAFTGQFILSLADLAVTGIVIPASASPGQTIPVSWTVTNQGNVAVTTPLSEVVYLSDDAVIGNDERIASFLFTNQLPPQASITRTQQVTVPVAGYAGTLRVVVETDADDAV